MTTELETLITSLKRQWCEAVSVHEIPGNGYVVSTPFIYGDGDALPVFVRRIRDGWEVSDHGRTASQLVEYDFTLTDARRAAIRRLADERGATLEERGTLRLILDDPPTAEDIASFIQLLAGVAASVALLVAESQGEQFRTRARSVITEWLPPGEAIEENWHPPQDKRKAFPADLLIPGSKPVAAFFAGSTVKAERSISFVFQYREWRLNVVPVLAFKHQTLTSEVIYRAQLALHNDDLAVPVHDDSHEAGYRRLQRVLRDLGVPVRGVS